MGRISAFVLLLALMLAVFLSCSEASPAIMRKPYYRPYHVEYNRNKRDITDTSRSVERDVDSVEVERQDSRDVSAEDDDVTVEKNSVEKASVERSVENSREVPSVEDNTAEIDRSVESLEVPVLGIRVRRQAPTPTTNTTTAKPTVFESNERDDLVASVEHGTSVEVAASPIGNPAGTRVRRQAATPTTNTTTTARPATFTESNERDDLIASVEDGTSVENVAPVGIPAGTRVRRQVATPTSNSTTTARPAATFTESNERDDLVASVEDGTSLEDTAPVGKPAAAAPAVGKPAAF